MNAIKGFVSFLLYLFSLFHHFFYCSCIYFDLSPLRLKNANQHFPLESSQTTRIEVLFNIATLVHLTDAFQQLFCNFDIFLLLF